MRSGSLEPHRVSYCTCYDVRLLQDARTPARDLLALEGPWLSSRNEPRSAPVLWMHTGAHAGRSASDDRRISRSLHREPTGSARLYGGAFPTPFRGCDHLPWRRRYTSNESISWIRDASGFALASSPSHFARRARIPRGKRWRMLALP